MKNKKKSTSKNKTNKLLAILTLCTLGITIIILGQFVIIDDSVNKTMHGGTVINGYNLSGMSIKDAHDTLTQEFTKRAKDFKLTIHDKNNSWVLDNNDFIVNNDIHQVIEASQKKEIYLNQDEERSLASQFNKIGGNINVAFNYIFLGLDNKIDEIISSVENEPVDSTITFDPSNKNLFKITESISGKRVDKQALYNEINEQFLMGDNIDVTLSYIEEIPTITKEYNQELTQKISSFTTNVADSTGGRKHNVKLALSQFDGMIIEPHQMVSFNDVIGSQSTDNGYKNATIIYNGEFTDGIGGGICQASTTLYNALLLGGVEINEVHRHTLPVRYVPLALDAMVAEYTSDLKFTNTSNYPIYIHTYSDSNSVSVELYSHPLEYKYKTRSETIDTIKSHGDKIIQDYDGKYSSKVLFKGEYFRISYPKDGYEAKAYLQKYLGDHLIEETEIRHEIYQAQPGVVIEGVEELPAGISPIDSGVKIYEE